MDYFDCKKSDRSLIVLDKICLLLNVEKYNVEYGREVINIIMLFCLNFNKTLDSVYARVLASARSTIVKVVVSGQEWSLP